MAFRNHSFFHYIFTAVHGLGKSITHSVISFLVGFGGLLILQQRKSPWDILIGLPLTLIGGGFVINNLWSAVLSIFYLPYNRGVCVLCEKERFKNHAKIKQILGLNKP